MKTRCIISFILIFFTGITAYAGTEKTIDNLKSAFKGESTASAKYAAFAEQARKEGFIPIAVMFGATSKAEAVHALNHKAVIEKLGGKVDQFTPQFIVKTTKENLEEAIKGENYEMTTMYPGFIQTAKDENANDAVKSFRWAMETEKKHFQIYTNALNALTRNDVKSLPKVYWVCPKCGNTYDQAKPEDKCAFCYTSRDKFIKFDK
ncbi:MAG: ferritin-like domain-containing protein [Bacteroidetes bacterium]|nr:ferritin-like domain-containing protein [Bacteroidota bacterium]